MIDVAALPLAAQLPTIAALCATGALAVLTLAHRQDHHDKERTP